MSRHYSFASTARSMMRAATQAERARQTAIRRQEAASLRALKQSEREAKADAKEAARQYVIGRAEEAEELSLEIAARERAIENLLRVAVEHRPSFQFHELYESYEAKEFDIHKWTSREPNEAQFLPKKPGVLVRWFSKRYAESVKAAKTDFETAKAAHTETMHRAQLAFLDQEEAERQQIEAHNRDVDALASDFSSGDHDAVVYFYKCLIAKGLSDEVDAVSAEVGYAEDSSHLVVDLELPAYEVVPEEVGFKYVKSADRIDPTMRPSSKRKALYSSLTSQVALKCVDTVFRGSSSYVDCLTLNGMLDAVDPATGQNIRVCLLSVRVTRDDFAKLNLRQVHPEQCLKTLRASVSRSPAELVPVKPIVELDMIDPRFIASSDVLSGLDSRQNLMELTPGEFESLITNLFGKMGLDTRQTQASRDGGVDCVAFDQRPIFGGKVVIQAKRYKHTVGVSAVRDLYGTVQNEGASKGILVTTSGYGKASFEFAKGKPLELLDGGNLLHLLMEHANIDAKIVIPEDWADLPIHGE